MSQRYVGEKTVAVGGKGCLCVSKGLMIVEHNHTMHKMLTTVLKLCEKNWLQVSNVVPSET